MVKKKRDSSFHSERHLCPSAESTFRPGTGSADNKRLVGFRLKDMDSRLHGNNMLGADAREKAGGKDRDFWDYCSGTGGLHEGAEN